MLCIHASITYILNIVQIFLTVQAGSARSPLYGTHAILLFSRKQWNQHKIRQFLCMFQNCEGAYMYYLRNLSSSSVLNNILRRQHLNKYLSRFWRKVPVFSTLTCKMDRKVRKNNRTRQNRMKKRPQPANGFKNFRESGLSMLQLTMDLGTVFLNSSQFLLRFPKMQYIKTVVGKFSSRKAAKRAQVSIF